MVKTLSDDNIKRIINGKRFNSEFGDSFLIDEYDELDLNDFSQKINVWADYYRVKFTTVDFIELINNKTIQINKKQIELCL